MMIAYDSPSRADVERAHAALTPLMVAALLVPSTAIAWEAGEVSTRTMNRIERARLWVKHPRGGYRETKLGSEVTFRLRNPE